MVCVYCRNETAVINSRLQKKVNQVWRRRRCLQCLAVFSTHEAVDYRTSWLVGTGAPGETQNPFNRDKLFVSIYRSCKHRKDPLTDAGALTQTVVAKLRERSEQAVIHTHAIRELVLVTLNRFDKTAAIQYKAFHEN
jgi:transcriptional regulator NrdR family protein